MKIYESITFDMATLEVVEERSFEYDGPVAECKGSVETKAATSPQAEASLKAMMPIFERIGSLGGAGQPLYNVPGTPSVTQYQAPSTSNLLPTSNWYNQMSPEVMSGIRAPYEDTYSKLMEGMGAGGAGGSARGGLSGAAGAASGKFAAEAAKGMGLQAWQMTSPGLNTAYQSDLGKRQWDAQQQTSMDKAKWGAEVAAMQAPYGLGAQIGVGSLPETFGAGAKK